ncbi:dephospho-CoA kinase [Hellea sp.]|nr:dephospho-CoA kinase [Hellea sp.]MDB4844232.1 dephospho-CoA kinase [Hellea sp.]
MIKVGLTGSIGMGKSTVANMFKNYGFPVFDADKVVHDLYKKGGAAINTIKNFYPEAVINNTVNREILRSFIGENPDKIGELESLIHPLVGAERDGFLKTNKNKEILVFDVPLLFETGLNKIMDIVVVVSAPYHIQYERVLSREGMTEKIFKGLLAKQLSDDAKKSMADIVIKTDDSLKTTNNQVKEFISSLGIKVN